MTYPLQKKPMRIGHHWILIPLQRCQYYFTKCISLVRCSSMTILLFPKASSLSSCEVTKPFVHLNALVLITLYLYTLDVVEGLVNIWGLVLSDGLRMVFSLFAFLPLFSCFLRTEFQLIFYFIVFSSWQPLSYYRPSGITN